MLAARCQYPVLTPRNRTLHISFAGLSANVVNGGNYYLRVHRVGAAYLTYTVQEYSVVSKTILFTLDSVVFEQGAGRYEYAFYLGDVLLDVQQFVYESAEEDTVCVSSPTPIRPARTELAAHAQDPNAHKALFDALYRAIEEIEIGGTTYTDEQAQDAAARLFTAGAHSGVIFNYDDAGNKINAVVPPGTTDDLIDGGNF